MGDGVSDYTRSPTFLSELPCITTCWLPVTTALHTHAIRRREYQAVDVVVVPGSPAIVPLWRDCCCRRLGLNTPLLTLQLADRRVLSWCMCATVQFCSVINRYGATVSLAFLHTAQLLSFRANLTASGRMHVHSNV